MRKLLVLAFALLIAGAVYGGDKKPVKLQGYVIDDACAKKYSGASDMADKIKDHPKSCADMCVKQGHSLYVDGKLYKFDAESNKKVQDLESKTKSEKGLQVSVEGTLDGETLHASKISETT